MCVYHHKVSKIIVYLSDDIKETWAKCELTEDVYQCALTGHYYKSSYLAQLQILANSNLCTDPAWKELLKNEPHASHFLHISTQDEVYISFTPNDEYGKFDRQLKITPMRYFKKHCPGVSSTYINEWIKKWVVTNNHHTIFYARTSDEIRHVYENGPPSCMSHKRSRFWGDGSSSPSPFRGIRRGRLGNRLYHKKY